MISASVDANQVKVRLAKLQGTTDMDVKRQLQDIGDEILRLSQFEVPHDIGTLQDSGVSQPVGDHVEVGYHTPYAARMHEHPEYHFQKGRKGKYLEDPIRRNASVLGIRFGKGYNMSIGKVLPSV